MASSSAKRLVEVVISVPIVVGFVVLAHDPAP
jgi:hypothetical protein